MSKDSAKSFLNVVLTQRIINNHKNFYKKLSRKTFQRPNQNFPDSKLLPIPLPCYEPYGKVQLDCFGFFPFC